MVTEFPATVLGHEVSLEWLFHSEYGRIEVWKLLPGCCGVTIDIIGCLTFKLFYERNK